MLIISDDSLINRKVEDLCFTNSKDVGFIIASEELVASIDN